MKKTNKTLLTIGTIGAGLAPIFAVVACGDSDVVPTSSADAIKSDAKFNTLKSSYTGYSTDKIQIIGHKQEVQKQSKAAIGAFNKAFGTNLEIEQVGGVTNYSQYLTAKFTGGAGDVGLVGLELAGEVQALGGSAQNFASASWMGGKSLIDLGGHKVIAAAAESLGVIYNKDVFTKNGITVHEGETSASATNGLVEANNKITDVYTDGLTLQSYKRIATQLNAVSGLSAFYSTSKTDAGNIWPYTNHLLSAAVKVKGKVGETTADGVFGSSKAAEVPSAIKDALGVYSIGSNVNTNTIDSAMGKLAAGQVAMSQNGTWAKDQIFKTNPSAKVGFLPMPVFGSGAHQHAQFMKGTTQKWALTTNDDAKKKTINMFLEWLYSSQTGLDALYGDFASETPYATSLTPQSNNPLFASAAHYDGNDVTEGELTLSTLPTNFNNSSAPLRNAIHDNFDQDASYTAVKAEFTRLANA